MDRECCLSVLQHSPLMKFYFKPSFFLGFCFHCFSTMVRITCDSSRMFFPVGETIVLKHNILLPNDFCCLFLCKFYLNGAFRFKGHTGNRTYDSSCPSSMTTTMHHLDPQTQICDKQDSVKPRSLLCCFYSCPAAFQKNC